MKALWAFWESAWLPIMCCFVILLGISAAILSSGIIRWLNVVFIIVNCWTLFSWCYLKANP